MLRIQPFPVRHRAYLPSKTGKADALSVKLKAVPKLSSTVRYPEQVGQRPSFVQQGPLQPCSDCDDDDDDDDVQKASQASWRDVGEPRTYVPHAELPEDMAGFTWTSYLAQKAGTLLASA
ncbi:hypothetical protein BDW71DRAFT_203759 [Aspergillus fruticulosus]